MLAKGDGLALGGRAGFTVGLRRLRGDDLLPPPGLFVGGTQETWWTGEWDET